MREAKKYALGYHLTALYELLWQRYQSLTTISGISFAIGGIVLSTTETLIKNELLAAGGLVLLLLVALISLGRHLYLIRDGIKTMSEHIRELSDADWNSPLEEKEYRADWWPETLFICLVVGVTIYGLSLVRCL